MIFKTIESEGLAHFSYLIGDEYSGVCAIIDPRRDVDVYLEIAGENNLAITHILETHIHADFVSGSRELAARTDAEICLSEAGEYGFEHHPLKDGDRLEIGRFTLQVLFTPGHTPEHICFLISGGAGAGEPWGLFTGDTLFAAEVGRPDLLGEGTEEELAYKLCSSLHEKILPLGDEIQIFPAHGQGSPCGVSVGERPTSTIGYERRHNHLLRIPSKDEFAEEVLAALSPAPEYYSRMKKINAHGLAVVGMVPYLKPLHIKEVLKLQQDPKTTILDVRDIEAFGGAHIAGAINIALRKSFPIWAGRILDPEKNVVLVLPDEPKKELVATHLWRIGIEKLTGFMQKGIRNWIESGLPFDRMDQISVHELRENINSGTGMQVLDVRSDEEWQKGHIPTAQHIHVSNLNRSLNQLDQDSAVAVYCGSGYRASLAASLLKRKGFKEVHNIPGSISAWNAAEYEMENQR